MMLEYAVNDAGILESNLRSDAETTFLDLDISR